MEPSVLNQLLSALFAVLAPGGTPVAAPSNRISEHPAVKIGCREAGCSPDQIADRWRQWRQNPEETPVLTDRSLAAGVLACLVLEKSGATEEQRMARALLPMVSAVAPAIPDGAVRTVLHASRELAAHSWEERRRRIVNILAGGNGEPPPYVANQITPEGFDELQRLYMAGSLGLHVALDGPPGVGKTQSVVEMSRLLEKPLFTRTCSSRTSEAHIIAAPVLRSDDGVTVTDYQNGPLAMAMEHGGVFYGDEFNLLREDVQKRLNAAFDDRRAIDRPDGAEITAAPGFWALISYNPSQSMASRDLDDSVADRFIHMHYRRWSPDFKAWIAWSRAQGRRRDEMDSDERFNIILSRRGIDPATGRFFLGEVPAAGQGGGVTWTDFFTGSPAAAPPPYQYRVYDPRKRAAPTTRAYSSTDLARILAQFTEALHQISRTGDAPLLRKIGLGNLKETEDLELFTVHHSSTRIETAAARHVQWLSERQCNPAIAQSYATRLVIDQGCYGQYRHQRLRETTTGELVQALARSMNLLADGGQYNAAFTPESLLASHTGSRKGDKASRK